MPPTAPFNMQTPEPCPCEQVCIFQATQNPRFEEGLLGSSEMLFLLINPAATLRPDQEAVEGLSPISFWN